MFGGQAFVEPTNRVSLGATGVRLEGSEGGGKEWVQGGNAYLRTSHAQRVKDLDVQSEGVYWGEHHERRTCTDLSRENHENSRRGSGDAVVVAFLERSVASASTVSQAGR
jgi:hypothetical protein